MVLQTYVNNFVHVSSIRLFICTVLTQICKCLHYWNPSLWIFMKSQNLQGKAQIPQMFTQASIYAEKYNLVVFTHMKLLTCFYTPLCKPRKEDVSHVAILYILKYLI